MHCALQWPALITAASTEAQNNHSTSVWDTRVPVHAPFENLEDGAAASDFLAWFPGVSREQVQALLEHAERSVAAA